MSLPHNITTKKRSKSHPQYRFTPSERPKQANKINRSRFKYDKDKLDSSDIDEIPGLELLNKGNSNELEIIFC